MPMEYIIPNFYIAVEMGMEDAKALEEHVAQLLQLDEDCFIIGLQQQVVKDQHKPWHGHHIKQKQFEVGDLVLLYDSKFIKHLGKLQMYWLGPYVVQSITFGGIVQLQQLDGAMFPKLINGSHLKPYRIGLMVHTS